MIVNFLDLKIWNADHGSVWREIESRWGRSDYEDETKRTGHENTLKLEWDAKQYARSRQAEYPDTGAQFNKIYDDGLTKWKSEMVDPVKTKWPKDNSGPIE